MPNPAPQPQIQPAVMPAHGLLNFTLPDGALIVAPDSLECFTSYVLQEQGDWFEDEIGFVRRLLAPGQKAVDVGAGYGVYALSMAKAVGRRGKVWAYEPASGAVEYLEKSIEANGFDQIRLERVALSNHSGEGTLLVGRNAELASLAEESKEGLAASTLEAVSVRTLDDCCEAHGWEEVSLVKIDAGGSTRRILQSGQSFLMQHAPLLLFDIRDTPGEVPALLLGDLHSLGYDAYRLVPGLEVLAPFDATAIPDPLLLNLFAAKPEKARELASRSMLLSLEELEAARSARWPDALISLRTSHGWKRILAVSPQGRTWGDQWTIGYVDPELEEALACHAFSADSSQPLILRYLALEHGTLVLRGFCQHHPHLLRLASLARLARDLGSRKLATASLELLLGDLAVREQIHPGEPFLSPSPRFDALDPGDDAEAWFLASLLESLEELGAYSSFTTMEASRQRVKALEKLGWLSEAMQRRQHALEGKAGLILKRTVDAPDSQIQ